MTKQAKHTSETLLNLKFSPAVKGYETLEVDKTLDSIIEDYKYFETELKKVIENSAKKDEEIKSLKASIRELELQIAEVKKQYGTYSKLSGASQDNIKLLKKIDIYERALYKKGVDPQKLLSDPDNC